MFKYLKILFLIFLFESLASFLYGQNSDSLSSAKAALTDSLVTDTITERKPPDDGFTPDTVFLTNGDKFTGNIINYEPDRLKIDAEGAGVISIKQGKILSVKGGSRIFKVEDLRKEVYVGPIQFSNDTGEIIIINGLTYGIRFSDMAMLFPLKEAKDSLLAGPESAGQVEQPVYKHLPDTVCLKNGERYTGNILSFEQGRLKIDAQGPGVIYIKWYKIASISGGDRQFKVEDQRGEIYIGHLAISKDTGELEVLGKLRYGIPLEDLVRMFPLEEEWYRGFKGTMGGGLNYTKSSDVLNINLDYNLYYVVKKWRFMNNFSYIETSTSREDPSVRISIDFQALYALPNKWVLSEINSFNRNDELGIKSRISFGAGGGYNLVLTDRQRLLALSGILQNSEKNIESADVIYNFELPVTLQHTVYSFLSPNLTSSTIITYYKGITEDKRYRIDASADITWEFIKWVKLQLSVYYNFDNKSVEGKQSEKDYGTVLSLLVDLK